MISCGRKSLMPHNLSEVYTGVESFYILCCSIDSTVYIFVGKHKFHRIEFEFLRTVYKISFLLLSTIILKWLEATTVIFLTNLCLTINEIYISVVRRKIQVFITKKLFRAISNLLLAHF